mgnify:CR=1 FL=1
MCRLSKVHERSRTVGHREDGYRLPVGGGVVRDDAETPFDAIVVDALLVIRDIAPIARLVPIKKRVYQLPQLYL